MATMPVILPTGTTPDMMPIALLPTTMATSAVRIGRLIATREPNATARMMTAIRIPISSLLPPAGVLAYPSPPSYSTSMPASRRSWTAFSAASNSAGVHLLDVEADRGERGLSVGADRGSARVVGTAHGDDVRYVGEVLDGLLDRGLRVGVGQSVFGVEDDVRGVQRLLGEPVLDRVGSALRLRAREGEGLVVLTSVCGVEHEDRQRDEGPRGDDAPRVAAGEVADPVQEMRHGGGPFRGWLRRACGRWLVGRDGRMGSQRRRRSCRVAPARPPGWPRASGWSAAVRAGTISTAMDSPRRGGSPSRGRAIGRGRG